MTFDVPRTQGKTLGWPLSLMLVTLSIGTGQPTGEILASPEEVVRKYRKMDTLGKRLTDSGWREAYGFFLKPQPVPIQRFLLIVDDGEVVSETPTDRDSNARKAEVFVKGHTLGMIDPAGRFSYELVSSWHEVPTKGLRHSITAPFPTVQFYSLVRADPTIKEGIGDEVSGEVSWRIEYFEYHSHVTPAVALEYLLAQSRRSPSPTIRNNAKGSIRRLHSLMMRLNTSR